MATVYRELAPEEAQFAASAFPQFVKNAGTNFLMSEAAYLQVANEAEVNQCPPWEIRGKSGLYNLFEVVRAKRL